MSLTYEEFNTQIQDFLERSNFLGDGWQLCQGSDGTCYLYKKHYNELGHDKHSCLENQTIGKPTFDDPQEVDIISENHRVFVWEYNIVYNISYEVPALYFNVSRLGCAAPLVLEQIWNLCSEFGAVFDMSSKDMWFTLTQQEHTVTRIPHFALHACNTQKMMKQLLSTKQFQKRNYLITWLSTVGSVVGLRMRLEYDQLPRSPRPVSQSIVSDA